ncbi:MAG TPA: hypothetical protein VF196_05035 [Casimicrobiaceae bacterium]
MRSLVLAGLAALGLAAAAPGAGAVTSADLTGGPFSDCFWTIGAINGDRINIAYPDAGANYWAAQYEIPDGATLRLHGTFPHSRYSSIIAYNPLGAIQDALADFQIDPDPGSVNPFRPGVRRDAAKRSFTITISSDPLATPLDPDQRTNAPARNVLHPAFAGSKLQVFVWRVYIPDRGRDLRGGVPLPQPELTLADGRVLTGQPLCDALTSQQSRLPDPSALLIAKDQYDAMRYQAGKPAYFPAQPTPVWRVQYTRAYLLALWTGEQIADPGKSGQTGFFPNIHNQYMRAAIHRKLGKVFAVRGKMPTTPATYRGERYLKPTQLRYESFCMNESPLTTRVMDCVYDEEVPLASGRRYLVVTSRAADRPKNATAKCGVAWVRWSPRGDGGRDHDFGWFQIRNMLPSPDFHHAVQDTRKPGDERAVLGPYFPKAKYYRDKKAFEKLGCPAR